MMSSTKPGTPTYRWAWAKPFGESGNKSYDRLILVGEVDGRYGYLGKDTVIFDVPFDRVRPLTIKCGRHLGIQLATNPLSSRVSSARPLFTHYQTTLEELEQRYA
jgi:hypothetical protein